MQSVCYNWANAVAYLPAALATAISFRFKLAQHGFMLDQLADFDVRAAKCSVHADRAMLESEIAELYDEIGSLPETVVLASSSVYMDSREVQQERERLLEEAVVLRRPT